MDPDIFNRDPRDHYDLLQRLGGGTYGEVFKVRNSVLLHHPQASDLWGETQEGKGMREGPGPWFWFRDAEEDSGKWSPPDCQLPLYKARDKVTGDLVALKMVKMEPGEDRTQELLPHTPHLPGWWRPPLPDSLLPTLPPCSGLFSSALPCRR